MEPCNHPSTVQLFGHIFKCSLCGALWDESTPGQREAERAQAIRELEAREDRERRRLAYIRRSLR